MFSGSWNTALSVIFGPMHLRCSKKYFCTLCKYTHTMPAVATYEYITCVLLTITKKIIKFVSKRNEISLSRNFPLEFLSNCLLIISFHLLYIFCIGILTRIESINCPSTFFHLTISCTYCKLYFVRLYVEIHVHKSSSKGVLYRSGYYLLAASWLEMKSLTYITRHF